MRCESDQKFIVSVTYFFAMNTKTHLPEKIIFDLKRASLTKKAIFRKILDLITGACIIHIESRCQKFKHLHKKNTALTLLSKYLIQFSLRMLLCLICDYKSLSDIQSKNIYLLNKKKV